MLGAIRAGERAGGCGGAGGTIEARRKGDRLLAASDRTESLGVVVSRRTGAASRAAARMARGGGGMCCGATPGSGELGNPKAAGDELRAARKEKGSRDGV